MFDLFEDGNQDETKAQLASLREWREAYYNGTPVVSDAVYDSIEDQVREAGQNLPEGDPLRVEIAEFLAGVGARVSDGGSDTSHWSKVKHKAPMGSLNKAQDEPEFLSWFASCNAASTLVISDKCDGISIALYYTEGKLTQAVTRGDGEVGEDITRNVLKMKGIVPYIKGFDGFIRGEIVLRKSDHAAHFPTYANPRNAASGIAKRLDGDGSEHLTVLHYQMIRFSGTPISRKAVEFRVLAKVGAEVPSWFTASSAAEALQVYADYKDSKREALDYDIDGLVIEFDALSVMESLGMKNHRPKGAVAFKFPHDKKPTILRDVQWQVGNTGRVTPVAIFDPVKLAGATVSQASLHNITNIDRLVSAVGQELLFHGDRIVVSRRNDVIPYVEEVLDANVLVEAKNDPNYEPPAFNVPTDCPACGTALTRHGEHLTCPNEVDCPAQVAGLIKTWVRKIGLKGVGTTLIDTLCEQGIIRDPADLYTLDAGELANVLMDGRRVGGTADTVVKELASKKELPLHVLTGSLNIPLCSRSTMKTVVDAGFDTLDKMRAASMTEIASIPGLGVSRAEEFVWGMKTRKGLIDKLLSVGITIQAPSAGPFKGKTVCMTGFRDSDMTEAIENQGGTVKSGVSKDLDLLVAKDPKSNSGKAKKARDYGVEIIGPDEMWSRLGGRP